MTTDKPERVTLDHSVDISRVSALAEMLIDVARRGIPTEIDASAVARIDASGIQLLCAFMNHARDTGFAVSWVGQSDTLKETASLLNAEGALGLASSRGDQR